MKIKVFLMAVGILLSLSALANDLVVNENHSESCVELQDSVSKERFFSVKLGYGIGGTMPFPLPAEMRSINGFKPLCNLSLHGVYHILFDKKVGMKVGVGIDRKGMVADATVKNYSMSITDDAGGVVSGRWTGDVQMKAVQTALTIPVAVEWYPSDRWDVNFGPYFSYLVSREFSGEVCNGYLREGDPTGAKIEIGEDAQTFDFSEDMRRFQWGLSVGVDWTVYKKMGLSLDLNWGLNNIFKSDFETITFNMYPIFGVVGLSYSFN